MPEDPSVAGHPGAAVTVTCRTPEDTRELARRLGGRLVGGDVVVLSGPLGAGKTTFVQGLARGLGVSAPVTSPTFVLARHQRPDPDGPRPDGPDLVHVDAYRLSGALELDDLDLDSDLATSVVVVEWGDGLAERLSPDRVEVRLERGPTAARHSEAAEAAEAAEAGAEPRVLSLGVVGRHPHLHRTDLVRLAAAAGAPQEAPC